MEVCTTFKQLKPLLEAQPEESTFGIVFIPNVLDVHDVIAARMAAKWCDTTVAVCLKDTLKATHHKILQDAGVDILLSCSSQAPKLGLDSGDINSGFILKVILAIMPSAVVVQQAKIDLLQVILRINHHYADLFTPIFSETPVTVLNETEQQVHELLLAVRDVAQGGEVRIEKLTTHFKKAVHQKYAAEGVLKSVSSVGEICEKSLGKGENYLHVNLTVNNTIICDGVTIKTN